MHPILLTIGSFQLSTYGVLVASAYLTAIWWLERRRTEMGLSEDAFWELVYWLFGGALVGGKLGFVIVERDVTLLWRDPRYGFVFYGGFVGAVAAGWIASRRRKLDFARLSDYFGVALPIGQSIGRIGCLMAGCCYGRPTTMPWGIVFTSPESSVLPSLRGVPLHPTEIYHSLADALIAFLVWRFGLSRVRDGRWRRGSAFLLYVALYAVGRFIVEFYRGDPRGGFYFGLSPSQLVAVAALAAVAGAVAWRRRA
ncbi:MAG: prolipoprotein diacylglyceryl transferase [Elusimicrobia bacterium]|nr:prolipoprotein diacylglyceryl transferase [Elusimicrobiota bacterium]